MLLRHLNATIFIPLLVPPPDSLMLSAHYVAIRTPLILKAQPLVSGLSGMISLPAVSVITD